jgi:HEAT repeat protein
MRRAHARPLALLIAHAGVAIALLAGCESNMTVRRGAPSILAAFEPPSPEAAARMATDEFDANARYQGIQLLSTATFAGEPLYVDLFRRSTQDADPGVRAVAARALGTNGQASDALTLAPLLKDKDPTVRLEAARGLQRLHNPGVVPALMDSLSLAKEEDERVRREAALALAQYREPRVIDALITSLDDESVAVNFGVRDALRMLTGQDLGLARRDWQAWYRATETPFAAATGYTFPVFNREKRIWEYVPFVPQPANETPALPAGLSPIDTAQPPAQPAPQPSQPARPAK